jgi:hypothetical protein
MKAVLLSTAAWPNLHYFYWLVNSEKIFIEQHETYARQTYRNRYEILSANGVLPLTIPVRRLGNHTKTRDVVIDYSTNWQTQHWRALTSAYRKSPFFEYFEDELRSFYSEREELLLRHNLSQLRFLDRILKSPFEFFLTDSFEKHPAGILDLRAITDPRPLHKMPEATAVLKTEYYQTFREKFQFVPNLSVLDLVFNLGVKAKDHLRAGGATA